MQHLDRAREPLDQPVVDRLVREHARGRRALLARVVERGLHERGDDVVEVGVGVHDHAVLAAHLGHHALQVALAGRHLGGAADDLQADRPRAGEGDRVHARVADELRADRRPRRAAARARPAARRTRAARARACSAQRGRLLGGLEHHGVAGRQPGGDHPERDRDREVPGRDDGDDAARAPAQLVALAGQLDQLAAGAGHAAGMLLERDRGARVVLEEVDRLADVAVGLAPRLRGLADLERADLQPPLAQPRGGLDQHLGALRPRSARPSPEPRPARSSAWSTSASLATADSRDHALGVAGIGRDQRAAVARVVADPHRHLDHRLGVEGLQRARAAAHASAPGAVPGSIRSRTASRRAPPAALPAASPRACSYRNDSLDVFSSSRRTRYAMPATRSPTGQYVRTRRPWAAIAVCSGSPRPRRTCSSRSSVGAAGEPVVGDRVRDRAQVVRGDRDADRAAARRAAAASAARSSRRCRPCARRPASTSRAARPGRARGPSRRP